MLVFILYFASDACWLLRVECVCVHVCILVVFLSACQMQGVSLCAEQIKIRMAAMVSVLMDPITVRLIVICREFVGIFGVSKGN